MSAAEAAISRGAFEIIAGFLRSRTGIVLAEDKSYLIESRLRRVGRLHGIEDLTRLAGHLLASGPQSEALAHDVVEAMTTNETLFFRDERPFTHLRDVALPALNVARPAGRGLRIWSAASASGQEAYSIAMILDDLGQRLGGRTVELVGTDLSREQVERASSGLYSHFEVQRGLPVQMLVRHFDRENQSWRIKPKLRERVDFRQWNLLDDLSPLGRFDIVFCRNVLIYFDQKTKTQILTRIARQLAPDGFLYLGGAETLVGLRTPFGATPGEPVLRLTPSHGAAAPERR